MTEPGPSTSGIGYYLTTTVLAVTIEYVGLILSVDWLLDRFRTTVNAFGDSVGAAVVEGSFPRTDRAAARRGVMRKAPAPAVAVGAAGHQRPAGQKATSVCR